MKPPPFGRTSVTMDDSAQDLLVLARRQPVGRRRLALLAAALGDRLAVCGGAPLSRADPREPRAVDVRLARPTWARVTRAHSRFPGHALTPTGVMAIRCKQFHLPDL